MTSKDPATNTRSPLENVEFGPSDHSSAMQLLSLGKPRIPTQLHTSLKQDEAESQPQMKSPSFPTEHITVIEHQLRHDSPIATHGRHHKKRRMLEAKAAATTILRENHSMVASSDELIASEIDDKNRYISSSSLANQTFDEGKDCKGVNNRQTNDSGTVEQARGSSSEPEKDLDPTSLKILGQKLKYTNPQKLKYTNPRHSSLLLNRRKKYDTKEDINDHISVSTKQPKKFRGKKNCASKSSLDKSVKTIREYVDNPTDLDILLGMPKLNRHPGNEVYRNTVRNFKPQIKTKERIEVARDIIDHIHDVIGGRFLKVDKHNRWEVMPHLDVMTKVGKAIVELRNKAGPTGRKSQNNSRSQDVLESLKEDETKTTTSRPKRKATLGRKVNDFMNETMPSSSGKKQKVKLSVSKNKIIHRGINRFVPVDRKFEEFVYKLDPNEYYVEESAHIYHNPPFPSKWTNGVAIEDLRPIPLPPPLPSFPKSDSCKWTFDENSRVLIADFLCVKNGGQPLVTLEDSKFLFEMQERTDITVISRGLLNMSKIDPSMWSLDYLRKCVGREFYHKFRRFDRIVNEEGIESYTEKDNLYSMRFEDYSEYCEKRESYMINASTCPTAEEQIFTFEDHLGKTHSVGVGTSALYMIDLDMKRLTPLLNRNFLESFELPAVLPGGSHCMMNSVTPDARPFMGPNLYVTPPASFTHFHQDGHGTVDSGHLCINGFNEVVMLRRLTERHKKHALWILSGKKPGGFHFDGLYSMPHGDGLGEKPSWPSVDRIAECKKMGYCPSVFTLEPGDLVHINKGRLHAFRKMSTSKLSELDCHAVQRRNLIESKGIAGEEKLCVSVAWDWMYRGITSAGINREVCTVLEGSTLNRRNDVTSLAIPELSLLQMAKTIPARSLTATRGISFLGALQKKNKKKSIYESSKEEICKGIYPGVCIVVGQHLRALNVEESKSTEKSARLSIAKIPDTQENPQTCPLDPYGDSDFECKLCRKELSNVYFHCDGCEKLLSKDFNICRGCYLQKKFEIRVQMHPSNPKRHATLNHMGDNKFNRQSRCPCKNGPACNHCGFCLGCSCRCHTWFTMRTRLCNAVDEEKLLQTVKDTAVENSELKSTVTGGFQKTAGLELDEITKHLRDRLKDAGDDEILNEDKKDDTKVEEEDDQKLLHGNKKDEFKRNEEENVIIRRLENMDAKEYGNRDGKIPNDIKKDHVEGNKFKDKMSLSGTRKYVVEDEQNGAKDEKVLSNEGTNIMPTSSFKNEEVKDKNGDEKFQNGDEKEKLRATDDEKVARNIEKYDSKKGINCVQKSIVTNKDEQGTAIEDDGHKSSSKKVKQCVEKTEI